ncbi:MAG: HNH endonuclease [Anaerolineae bacterium]|nr:HNH endonuclease [Anaerolineae bacterium]
MRSDNWLYDRDDVPCPNCGNACYLKHMGQSFGDNYSEKFWKCACCGWYYIERNPPSPQVTNELILSSPSPLETTTPESYFFFNALPYETALALKPQSNEIDVLLWTKTYIRWSNVFDDYAKRFYLYQRVAHLETTFEKFRQIHDLDEFSQEAFWQIEQKGLNKEWQAFRHERGLEEHDQTYRRVLKFLESHLKDVNQLADANTTSFNEYKELERLFPLLDEIWFNEIVVICDNQEQLMLKYLPYSQYLRTFHWRRIRSALILLNEERCSYCGCKPHGLEGGYRDMHVHHMSYSNRGRERYRDVILLCRSCHKEQHNMTEPSGDDD